MSDCYFTTADGEWFTPTDICRGPWSEDSCHAGPPTGMLARALESLFPEHQLTRITVNLTRAVPMAGFRIIAEAGHAGRSVATSTATLVDSEGRALVTAQGMHLAGVPADNLPSVPYTPPALAGVHSRDFPIRRAAGHQLTSFRHSAEFYYPEDQNLEPGPLIAWMRCPPLLADEVPSPFQRICPLADCGNGFSRNAEPWDVSFINPDLTVVLHRQPEGDWLGMDAVSRWEDSGIGMSDALLFDQQGAVGRAVQTLLLRKTR